MLFAGFNVSDGRHDPVRDRRRRACSATSSAPGSPRRRATTGAIELLEKNRLIHINHKHLDWADRWFQRHGDATVFFTRMLPIIRTFISLPAGVARMPFWRFTVLTSLGCIPWVLMLALIGREVGDNWEEWRDNLHYLDYVVARGDRRRHRLPADPPAPAAIREPAETGRAPGRRRAGARPQPRPRGGARRDPGPDRAAARSRARRTSSLVPWLAGWDWDELDAEARKSFEVALHAGTAAALLIGQRREIADELAAFDARRAAVVALSFVPPAVAGLRARAADRGAARRARGTTAAGLVGGRGGDGRRRPRARRSAGRGDAGAADGLALGLAQAAALVPGVSRNGATLTAARARALHPRAGEPALAHRRAAGDRRRGRAQGRAAAPARASRRARPGARGRRRAPRSPRRSPRSG